MPSPAALLLGALGLLAVPTVGVAAAYAVGGAPDDGAVAPNVVLAGADVGGLEEDELRQVVVQLAQRWATTPVVLDDGASAVTTTAAELGSSVNQEATVDAVLEVGRDGWFGARAVRWVGSLAGERELDVELVLERAVLDEAVPRLDPGPRQPPVEPSLTAAAGAFTVVPGQPGAGLSADDVAAGLDQATGQEPELRLALERRTVEPRFTTAELEALVPEAVALTEEPFAVQAGDRTASIGVDTLRSWIVAETDGRSVEIGLDRAAAQAGLQAAVPFEQPAVDARFDLQGGRPVIIPEQVGQRCCAETAADELLAALRAGAEVPSTRDDPLVLPLVEAQPARTQAQLAGLGVVEEVSTFTTNHPAGQPRVRNIHRIADLVRGQLILPGEVLSINGLVGPRTLEKGFVAAPAIVGARLGEEVGGGISQFMTTLFNAAWFAGLDFDEYQAHTIYISRYPYGREATINFPHPDLAVRNTTPYGVLVWPTYTETSITVTLYSTKFVDVEQTGQTTGRNGSCTTVRTERTTRYRDGRPPRVDTFGATYQAAEGFRCGDQYPPPPPERPAAPPTTAAPPAAPATTAAPPATAAPATAAPGA